MGAWISTATSPCAPPWSSLPPDIVDLVRCRLPSHIDRVRFAAVCRLWRHVAIQPTAPPPLPWIAFCDDGERLHLHSLPDGKHHSISLEKHARRQHGVFGRWVLLESSDRTPCHRYSLRNPLTGDTIRLPRHWLDSVRDLNLDGSSTWPTIRYTDLYDHKIIVCSGDLIAAMIRASRYGNPGVMMCCKPGMTSWSMRQSNGLRFEDIAFYKGDIYTVTAAGDLFVHEISECSDTAEPRIHPVKSAIQVKNKTVANGYHANDSACYLVPSCTGKLLMVQWIVPQDYYDADPSGKAFRVFAADFGESRWMEVESLGDQVLFVSPNCSQAIRASDHGNNLQGNTIYFLHDGKCRPYRHRSHRICGVYHMNTKVMCPISVGELHVSGVINATWFFP